MKKLTTVFVAALFVVGLSFTSCSNDDKYVKPETPEHLPTEGIPGHLPDGPTHLPT